VSELEKAETGVKRWLKKEYIIGGLGLTVTIVACVLLIRYWEYLPDFRSHGYLGAFVLTLLTGIGLPLPFLYVILIFALGAVLNPALLGIISGLGAAIGQLLLYVIGYLGRPLLAGKDSGSSGIRSKIYFRIPVWVRRKPSLFNFLANAILNPFGVPITLALSASGFRTWKFFLTSFAGNTVKCLVIAYCGYFGLGSLLSWLGLG
jgi:membrane protein DedA with SNARE-associated domain